MSNPITYHGDWWVPDPNHRFSGEKHIGTLTYYGDEKTHLQIIHKPTQGRIFTGFQNYDVIWGEDVKGNKYTLFNSVFTRQEDFSYAEYAVNFVLIGAHVFSRKDKCFATCATRFPYLRNWAHNSRIDIDVSQNDHTICTLDMGKRDPIVEVNLADEINAQLWGQLSYHFDRYNVNAEQVTNYNLETAGKESMDTYLRLISEFSQFLSIALYCKQEPSEIAFKLEKSDQVYVHLLFCKPKSADPRTLSLIKFDKLKAKVPAMMKAWHANYDQISPISHYLVSSLHYSDGFDAPDFLIIAQALDGYYKRIVNKREGTSVKQYKQQIDKLLKHFEKVEAIQKCKIDSDVLTQSRHKYSHLIPDDDAKVSKAASGDDLYWLTQKCKILLTCCILEIMGLSIDEINTCCNQSPIDFIIHSLPIEND